MATPDEDGFSVGLPDGIVVDNDGETNGGDLSFFDQLGSLFGSASDSVFSGAESLKTTITGVTRADVASGAVDPLTLTREQRAQLTIEGATGGLALNPWTVGFDLTESEADQLGAGGVLVFDVEASTPLAVADQAVPPRFALLWDESLPIEAQGTVKVNLVGPSVLVAEVGARAGRRLTLWVDSTLTCTLRKINPPGSLARTAAEEKAAIDAADPLTGSGGITKSLGDAFDKFIDVQVGVGLALVVVVGIGLFLFIESGGPREVAGALRPV